MERHRNHQGIKKPAPTGRKARGKETLTREGREFGEAAMTVAVSPLDTQNRGLVMAANDMSGGLLLGGAGGAVGRADVGPLDIGAQVFAADGAIGGPLDGGTIVGRNVSAAVPVADNLRRNAQRSRQCGLASGDLKGFSQGIHVATINTWGTQVNR